MTHAIAAIAAGAFLLLHCRGAHERDPGATNSHEQRIASLAAIRPALESADSLRNPQLRLFGLHDAAFPRDLSALHSTEQRLGVAFSIVSFNVTWGDDQPFPRAALGQISASGSVAMITWEPQVTTFASTPINQLPPRGEREYRSLAAVGRGAYDFHIDPWATAAARYGRPVFLRFAPEMNDPYRHAWGPQNGNRPEDFVAAWRRVWRRFREANASNVIWVWSPQTAIPHFDQYYPGHLFVDWTGAAALNYGNTEQWSRWWALAEILEKSYPILRSTEKPMMLTEFGTVDRGGDPATWYAEAFRALRHQFDHVHALILVHRRELPPRLTWSVATNPRVVEVIAEEMLRNDVRPIPQE